MSQYTPGPWGINPESDGTEIVAYSVPWKIRSVVIRNHERHDPNWIANTQLCSSAPELLEALKKVLDTARGTSGRIIIEVKDEDTLRAVIAKAEGK